MVNDIVYWRSTTQIEWYANDKALLNALSEKGFDLLEIITEYKHSDLVPMPSYDLHWQGKTIYLARTYKDSIVLCNRNNRKQIAQVAINSKTVDELVGEIIAKLLIF